MFIDPQPAELTAQDLDLHEDVELFVTEVLSQLHHPDVPDYGLPAYDYLNSFRLVLALYSLNGLKPMQLRGCQHTTTLRYNGQRVLYPSELIVEPLCTLGLIRFHKDHKGQVTYWPVLNSKEMRFGQTP